MNQQRVNDILDVIYKEAGIPEGNYIGDMYKADFERQAYYRAKNSVTPAERRDIATFSTMLQQICGNGFGEAAANQVLFRLGVFLHANNYPRREN